MSSEEAQASSWLYDNLKKLRNRKERKYNERKKLEKELRRKEFEERRRQEIEEQDRVAALEWRLERERRLRETITPAEYAEKARAIMATDEYKDVASQWAKIKISNDPKVEKLIEDKLRYEAYLSGNDVYIDIYDLVGDLKYSDYRIVGIGGGHLAEAMAIWYYRDDIKALYESRTSDAQMAAALEFTKGDVHAAYRMLTQ